MLKIYAMTRGDVGYGEVRLLVLEKDVGLYFATSKLRKLGDPITDPKEIKWRIMSSTSKRNFLPTVHATWLEKEEVTTRYLRELQVLAIEAGKGAHTEAVQ